MPLEGFLNQVPTKSQEELESRVKRFYEKGYKDEVEEKVKNVSKKERLPLRVTWDERLGLKNISSPGGGFDLKTEHLEFGVATYAFHNIHYESELGIGIKSIGDLYADLLMED